MDYIIIGIRTALDILSNHTRTLRHKPLMIGLLLVFMAAPVSTSILILFSSSDNRPIGILIEGKELLIAIGIDF